MDGAAVAGLSLDSADVITSVFFVIAVVLLVVLTGGVAYLSIMDFLDRQQESENRRAAARCIAHAEAQPVGTILGGRGCGGPRARAGGDLEVSGSQLAGPVASLWPELLVCRHHMRAVQPRVVSCTGLTGVALRHFGHVVGRADMERKASLKPLAGATKLPTPPGEAQDAQRRSTAKGFGPKK